MTKLGVVMRYIVILHMLEFGGVLLKKYKQKVAVMKYWEDGHNKLAIRCVHVISFEWFSEKTFNFIWNNLVKTENKVYQCVLLAPSILNFIVL